MYKTILVPIDFSVASLNTLKIALENNKEFRVRAILMYAELLGDSIPDLLFYSHDKIVKANLTSPFSEALSILQNRYSGAFYDYVIKVFHGYNKSAFNVFGEINKVDEIYIPKSYKLKSLKRAFDPIPIIKGGVFPIMEADWKSSPLDSEQEQLTSFFN